MALEDGPSTTPGSQAPFPATMWSQIVAARDGSGNVAAAALAQLCQAYWFPLYAFLRRSGRSPHDAQDLTQGFFADLLRRDWLAGVSREKGKFRTFLLACLINYVRNEHARQGSLSRHPPGGLVSFDAQAAEERYRLEPPDEENPARAFDRQWAVILVERVLRELQQRCETEGSGEQFEVLLPHLSGQAERGAFAAVAARLNLSEGAARVAATRLRTRFRELLRQQIAQTVATPREVDDEIGYLFGLFEK
jgi:DNA-directed RNA polymerase specialized sigma24 family protein